MIGSAGTVVGENRNDRLWLRLLKNYLVVLFAQD